MPSQTTTALERHAFAETIAAVVAGLDANPEKGLTTSEARARLRRDGANKFTERPPPWWRKLLEPFNQLVIWILIAATIPSEILGDWLEAIAIVAIALLHSLLGFFQKRKAEEALSSLAPFGCHLRARFSSTLFCTSASIGC